MNLTELVQHTVAEFQKIYGRAPRWIAAAPGRVNLIGEHTDYNDGFVFPMAIERYTVICADRAADGSSKIQFRSTTDAKPVTIDTAQPITPLVRGVWANYPAGVIAGCIVRGQNPGGLDTLVHSNVPLGGGLSSSAALEVATATLVEAVTGKQMNGVAKALLCQKAEHDFAGMPCGIMDQFISALGQEKHVLLLDCRSREFQLVPMTDDSVQVLIINTNVKHELSGSEFPTRRKQSETAAQLLGVPSLRDASAALLETHKTKLDDVSFRRARHVIGEIERTQRAAAAMRASDWTQFGALMYASHESLRADYEVSCHELDTIVAIAHEISERGGVYGCRMTGGGFGGCCVALVKTALAKTVAEKISFEYQRRTNIAPSLFTSRPGAGATIVK